MCMVAVIILVESCCLTHVCMMCGSWLQASVMLPDTRMMCGSWLSDTCMMCGSWLQASVMLPDTCMMCGGDCRPQSCCLTHVWCVVGNCRPQSCCLTHVWCVVGDCRPQSCCLTHVWCVVGDCRPQSCCLTHVWCVVVIAGLSHVAWHMYDVWFVIAGLSWNGRARQVSASTRAPRWRPSTRRRVASIACTTNIHRALMTPRYVYCLGQSLTYILVD